MSRITQLWRAARREMRHAAQDPRRGLRRLRRGARAGLGIARGMLVYHAAWHGLLRPRDQLAEAVSELLLIGFHGANAGSSSARLLARQVKRGQVGGVFFVTQNIGSLSDLTELMALFRTESKAPLIAIDHEGGIVQRLTEVHGLPRLPAAKTVGESLTLDEARGLYTEAGVKLAALGFNVNLGPVLDIERPGNPVIAKPRRAFGSDPVRIAAYGEAFCQGFAASGILCTAKHFPGHGSSVNDSHYGVADITADWSEAELEPFAHLFASPDAPQMVMMGHLRHDRLAPDGQAATLSPAIVTGLLRGKLGYRGVVVTDDVDMEAVSTLMSRKEAVIRALAAGCDLIMIKNLFGYDPLLPQRVVGWVRQAIAEGQLTEEQILASAARLRAARETAERRAREKAPVY